MLYKGLKRFVSRDTIGMIKKNNNITVDRVPSNRMHDLDSNEEPDPGALDLYASDRLIVRKRLVDISFCRRSDSLVSKKKRKKRATDLIPDLAKGFKEAFTRGLKP